MIELRISCCLLVSDWTLHTNLTLYAEDEMDSFLKQNKSRFDFKNTWNEKALQTSKMVISVRMKTFLKKRE